MQYRKISFVAACFWAVWGVVALIMGEYVAASGMFVAAIAWMVVWNTERIYTRSVTEIRQSYALSIEKIRQEYIESIERIRGERDAT